MLSMNDLQNGSLIMVDSDPYEVIEIKHLHMGRGGSSAQAKIKNLRTGQVLSRNYKPADQFEEANLEKKNITYLYGHRGEFFFNDAKNPKERFSIPETNLSDIIKWLKPNVEIEGWYTDGKIISLKLPIKMEFKVKEAPPGIKGDTAQGGTKTITLENGTEIQAPLFINEGDTIRVNTQSGEYAERAEKGK